MSGNTQSLASSFKADILNGLHAFGTSAMRTATTAPTPTATTSTAAGTLAAATYTYGLVAHTASGHSVLGNTTSATLSATGEVTITWTLPAGVTSVDIYGRVSGSLGLLAAGLTGTTYTDTGSATVGAAAPTTATSANPDVFYGALYLVNQGIGAGTTTYSPTGEVSGTNYTAGGVEFAFANPPTVSGTAAIVTPSASLVFTDVTLSSPFDTCLMYNQTNGNRAVAAFNFGSQTVTAGNFTLTMPTNAVGTALIQIS